MNLNATQLKHCLIGAVVIVVMSVVVGLACNAFYSEGIPLRYSELQKLLVEEATPWVKRLPEGVKIMTSKRAWALFVAKRAIFVDARPANQYASGHIPGALNLPYIWREFETAFKRVEKQLPRDKLIIVYCAGGT